MAVIRRATAWVAAVVAGHLAVHAVHGAIHGLVPVPTAGWQLAFVLVVVFAGPIAGLALLRRGRPALAGRVLALSGLGSVGFEVGYHFVLETPDHVGSVSGPWAGGFAATAVLGLVLAAGVAVAGGWVLVSGRSRAAADGHSSRAGSPSSDSSR